MDTRKTGVFSRLKTAARAHAAALRHRRPSRAMRIIFVVGQDGAISTISFLASILRASGEKVGVMTQQYVEIGDQRAEGSDQADVSGDPFRLQGLLAQMRRAGCRTALIEVPPELPDHQFAGITATMVVVRRCGDTYSDQMSTTARLAVLGSVLANKPQFVVYNRDDPSAGELAHLSGQEGVISFGTHQKAECKITSVDMHPKGSAVHLLIDHQTEVNVATLMTGKQLIYDVAAAVAAAYVLHVPMDAMEKGVRNQPQVPGQLEYIPLQRPYDLVLDASVTPGGLAESLEALKHFAKNRLIVVFGAPLGARTAQLPLFGEIIVAAADRVIITDGEYSDTESPQQVREYILQGVSATGGEAKTDEVPERRDAIEKVIGIARRGDIVLIAGVTQRAYRQLGTERLPWSDRKIIEELFEP